MIVPGLYMRAPDGDGAVFAFCSNMHRGRWLLATHTDRHPDATGHNTDAPRPFCASCSWCGTLLPAAGFDDCFIHSPGPCPAFTWEATILGLRCVQALSKLYGGRLPAAALDNVDRVAGELFVLGAFPCVELITLSWDTRDTWV
jgi:hypothetical protein